jgi:hypothetical protein
MSVARLRAAKQPVHEPSCLNATDSRCRRFVVLDHVEDAAT